MGSRRYSNYGIFTGGIDIYGWAAGSTVFLEAESFRPANWRRQVHNLCFQLHNCLAFLHSLLNLLRLTIAWWLCASSADHLLQDDQIMPVIGWIRSSYLNHNCTSCVRCYSHVSGIQSDSLPSGPQTAKRPSAFEANFGRAKMEKGWCLQPLRNDFHPFK